MTGSKLRLTLTAFVLGAVGSAVLVGCGETGPTYKVVGPITGKVTVNGQTVPNMDISFQFQGTTPAGYEGVAARTDAQGNFEVFTGKRKGAPPGNYKVVFSKMVDKDGKEVVATPESGMDLPQLIAAGLAKELVPAQYADVSSTPIEVTVEEGKPPAPLVWDLK